MRLALAAGICLLAASASAAPLPRYGLFVYRTFCIDQGGGDVGGVGLTVIRSREGDAALYEYTEGAIEWPLLADALKIDDAGLHTRIGGEDRLFDVDTVILCAGQTPLRSLYDELIPGLQRG